MNVRKSAATLFLRVLALMLVAYAVPGGAFAQNQQGGQGSGSGSGSGTGELDVNPGYAAFQREMYFQRFPAAREGGPTQMGGHDQIQDKKSVGPGHVVHNKSGPVFTWPVSIPAATSNVPTKRDEMVNDDMFQTFGYPVSDTQLQVIQRYNHNRLLEQAFDPEKIMWASTATAGMQATSAANGAASAAVNQAQSAIDFTKKYLTNFTAEAGNRWQKIRDQLFIPMAILLLLPGAVLAQVKAIVSQGSPVLGDTNPFEGILRSIIAIFLIPATFLVINYGIDVSNSITFTIADEYKRIFGTDMYEDAQCAQKRAFPVNPADRNDNAMVQGENPPSTTGNTAWDPYEALTLNLRQYDPCAKVDNTRTPDERVRDAKKITRMMMNGANVGLTGTWNVMCAFQMAFLYYLWCMGPIAAALWVWPMQRLRGALPSWIEGVVTLCFWSLFWNTTVLLMACFRGVGDSGTVIMSALNFLANVCVKYAFDFSALVSQGGASGVSSAVQQAMQGGAAAAGGGKGGAAGAAGHGSAGASGNHGATAGGHPTGPAGLNSALQSASAQNMHSGVFSSASSVPGLTGDHGMPLGNTLAGSHNPALMAGGGPNGAIGVGADAGLPPGVMPGGSFPGGSGLPGGMGPGGEGSILPASFTPGGGSPFSFASTASHNFGAGDMNLAAGANALGLHMNNGHMQVNPNALHNLQSQLNDPNSAAHRELAGAMNAMQHGDPRALQALAQQGANGIGGMDPQTSRALGAVAMDVQAAYQSGGLSQADMGAIGAFANGQYSPDGQAALGFSSDGTLMNNLTGAPMDFSNVTNLSSMALAGNPSYDPSLQLGTTYDPNTGLPSNQSFAQMVSDGTVQALPTNGLDGMARTLGTDMPSLVDANGVPIPPNAINAQGQFAPGYQPSSDVYALNSSTGAAMARYDNETHQWQAVNAQGQPNGVTMAANGDWVAPTSAGAVPVTYDNGSQQWYASNAAGNVIYDQNSGGMSTPQGVQLSYDGNTYYAANDSQIRYNQDQNSFVSTTTGAPVSTGQDGQWYASGTGNSIALNTSDNNLYMAGSNYSAATAVQYSASNDTYSAAGGQVYYDNAKSTFEVSGSGAPVNYSGGTWYASDTNSQIAYNTNSHQMEAVGSSAGLVYNQNTGSYATSDGQIYYNNNSGGFQTASGQSVTATGDTWYASGSNYTVAYDQQQQRFEAVGTNQPLSYGQNASGGYGWSAAGSNGSISYDTSTGSYSTYNNAPVTYSQGTGDSGTYYAAGTNGSVYYDNSAQTWAGVTPSGSAVAYNYDSQTQTWSPSGGASGGAVYQVDAAQQYQQSQQSYQQVAQHEYQAQQQYAQYAMQQQVEQQQQYQQQLSQQFAVEQQQLQQQYQQTYAQQYQQPYAQQQQQQYDQQQVAYNQPQQQYDQQQVAYNQQQGYVAPQYPDQGAGYGNTSYTQNASFDQSGGGSGYTSSGGIYNYDGSGGGSNSPTYSSESSGYSSSSSDANAYYEASAPEHHHGHHHVDSGYADNPEIATNYPTVSPDYNTRAAQPQPNVQPTGRPAGGLNAFVPLPAMRPKQPQPQPKQPQPGQPKQGSEGAEPVQPEGPVYKQGPLDMNAKQGGYVTDDEKRKRQQELLKESWAEYQEQQNPEDQT